MDMIWKTLAVIAVLGLWKLFWFLGKFLVALVLLWLERNLLSKCVRLEFPRNEKEIWSDISGFERFLKSKNILDHGAEKIKVERLGRIESEPEKNKTSCSLRIIYTDSEGDHKHRDLFFKFQTGSRMPLWLQAVRIAAETGISREVDFYDKIQPHAPLHTQKPLFCGKRPWLNVVCLILEYIPICTTEEAVGDQQVFQVIPDHRMDDPEALKLMLCDVAKLHAKFVGKTKTYPSSSWIPAAQGLDFCKWTVSLAPRTKPKSYQVLFKALHEYFCKQQLTLVHGDCRPGNMIFVGPNRQRVIFSDWEAVNAAPVAWDVTYAMVIGLPPSVRRSNQRQIVQAYHESFKAASGHTLDSLESDVDLLVFPLFFTAYTVTMGGFWENQGNTEQDLLSWGDRVLSAVLDVDLERITVALSVKRQVVEEVQALAKEWLNSMVARIKEKQD